MFFFKRPARSDIADFSSVGVDMHSHLIPGVDDGAIDVANSLLLISGLRELGFTDLYTTPHTLEGIHPNTKESLEVAFDDLTPSLPDDIKLNLSSEYFLDSQFQNQLAANTLMPLPGNRLLVEFSQISRPLDLEEILFDLALKGFQVIIAHPERYLFFHQHFDYFKRLKEMDVELQINALSLTRYYGDHIKQAAEKLVDKDMVDFIGTDLHHTRHLEALRAVPKSKHFQRLVGSNLLKNKSLLDS